MSLVVVSRSTDGVSHAADDASGYSLADVVHRIPSDASGIPSLHPEGTGE